MSLTVAAASPAQDKSYRGVIALLAIVGLAALVFIAGAALPYYLHFDSGQFKLYWPKRWWLLVHISGGIVALLAGPVQLWLGLTERRPVLHRRLGVTYLGAIVVSAMAAYYLAFHTDISLVFGAGLASLATAWLVTSGLAFAAIRRGLFEQHKEWMIRSYVVTTAFITFRALAVAFDVAHVGSGIIPRLELASWMCWALPLLITEGWLQGRKIFRVSAA